MASSTTAKQSLNVARREHTAFAKFDVVSDDSDHYYRSRKNGVVGAGAVHKKIMQEWKILQNHLPDSIYVRAYESRIDLLRAVIIGASGTPYHDALFFFDIAFPPDYPTRPPYVNYRSFGLRLNPNLYRDGTVCLSLLNTWQGEKRERWVPSQSTILQVLVSIQGLVLNEEPFFNEPGTGILGRGKWGKVARAYSEDKFALTCKTTLFLLRRPPKNFEAFVGKHFQRRGRAILRACSAYAYGRVVVGLYKDEDQDHGVSANAKVGKIFKVTVEQLYPQLFAAFKIKGAGLEGLVEQLKVVESSDNTTLSGVQGKSIVRRAFDTLKRVLGLKSNENDKMKKKMMKKMKMSDESGGKRNVGLAAALD